MEKALAKAQRRADDRAKKGLPITKYTPPDLGKYETPYDDALEAAKNRNKAPFQANTKVNTHDSSATAQENQHDSGLWITSAENKSKKGQKHHKGPAGQSLRDRGAKTSDRGAKTSDRGAKTSDRGAKTSDRGAKTSDRGAKTSSGQQGRSSNQIKASTYDRGAKTYDRGAKTSDRGAETSPYVEDKVRNLKKDSAQPPDRGAKTPDRGAKTPAPQNREPPRKEPADQPLAKITPPSNNDRGAETSDRGAETSDRGAETSDRGAKTSPDRGAKTSPDRGAKTSPDRAGGALKGGRPSKAWPSRSETAVLRTIFEVQQSGGGSIVLIPRQVLTLKTQLGLNTVRSALRRLMKGGWVEQGASSRSRLKPGASYIITTKGQTALMMAASEMRSPQSTGVQKPSTTGVQELRSSSSSYNITTTADPESLRKTESEIFAAAALRHGLENYGIGAPHIMQAWNFNRDRLKMEDYLLSVEHIGFYLRSAKGIEHPAAWAVRELKKGFYPQPAGFISWEDEQREKIRQAAQARRQQQLKQQTQDIEHLFPEWRLGLTDERVVEITGGFVPEDVAERLLHKAFIEEHMLRIQQLSATQLPLLPSEDD